MNECKIAEKLTELRGARGFTQEELAKRLSVSNKTVSKWENGVSMPDIPMLIALSKCYGVTVDSLLGLSEDKRKSTRETVCASFEELDHRESALRAFETVRSIVPATYQKFLKALRDEERAADNKRAIPAATSSCHRSKIMTDDFFEFTANSEDVNLAVMLLRNKSNFAWMKDPEKQRETVSLFKFLSDKDTLSVMYFIHSDKCSRSFTAEYISKNTGVAEARVAEILEAFTSVGDCRWVDAYLNEGKVRVYESRGDGVVLLMITLAYERMCGMNAYDYCLRGSCKMIGGN